MHLANKQLLATVGSLFLLVLFASTARAQSHVVDAKDLQGDIAQKSQTRQSRLDTLDRFFSSPSATKTLKSAHVEPQQVRNALSQLGDDEVADFAARAEQAQKQFSAGALTNQEITYVIIALATAVIILVIVAA